MRIDELRAIAQARWPEELVREHLRTDFPVIGSGAALRDALSLMQDVDVDLLPVVDAGVFVGIVTTAEILKLDEILDDGNDGP